MSDKPNPNARAWADLLVGMLLLVPVMWASGHAAEAFVRLYGAPVFGWPLLTMPQAVGLMLGLSAVTSAMKRQPDPSKGLATRALETFFGWLFTWGLLVAVHRWWPS